MSFPAKPGVRGTYLALLIAGPFLALLAYHVITDAHRREDSVAVDRLAGTLKDLSSRGQDGSWTADVAGLHRLGLVPREVGEADSAPKTPLVPRPVPYHGFYVLALEPPRSPTSPPHLRGIPAYAYCIYPADPSRTDLRTYLVCPWGMFGNNRAGKVSRWPEDENRFRMEWGIID